MNTPKPSSIFYKELMLSLIIFCITLGIIEGALRYYFTVKQTYNVETWKYAVQLKYYDKEQGLLRHKASSSATIMGREVEIDSNGLRKSPNATTFTPNRSILNIGDSITFGFGVGQNETFTDVMNQSFRKFNQPIRAINAGVGNHNISQIQKHYKLISEKIDISDVNVFLFMNDLERFEYSSLSESLKYVLTYQFLSLQLGMAYNLLFKKLDHTRYYSSLFNKENLKIFRNEIVKIKGLAKEKGHRLRFFIWPDLHRLEPYPFQNQHEIIGSMLEELDLNYVDLTFQVALVGNSKELLWAAADDPHPSAKVHKAIGDYLVKNL